MAHKISCILFTTFFSIFGFHATAQQTAAGNGNIIKLNIPALVFENFSLQYEHQVRNKRSLALSVRYRPVKEVPFKKWVEDVVDDTSIRVDLAKIGNIGITGEYRFYLGKKGGMQGFYIAPMLSYNYYKGDVPVNYYDYVNNTTIDKVATFKGSTNAVTAGLQVGAQWKLGEHFYFDWWIAGPNVGYTKGDFSFAGALNDIERISLQYKLEEIKQTIPVLTVDIPRNPDANGAVFSVKGPWFGVRAFGLNLGYHF